MSIYCEEIVRLSNYNKDQISAIHKVLDDAHIGNDLKYIGNGKFSFYCDYNWSGHREEEWEVALEGIRKIDPSITFTVQCDYLCEYQCEHKCNHIIPLAFSSDFVWKSGRYQKPTLRLVSKQ